MRDKIEKVLLSYDVEFSNDSTNSERGIRKEDYSELAEELVKLFLISPVISSVCSCDNVYGEIETKTNYCWYCLKTIKEQTDL
jgi:hypothetical protein